MFAESCTGEQELDRRFKKISPDLIRVVSVMKNRAIASWFCDGKRKREKSEVRHKKEHPNRDLQKIPIDAAKEFYRPNQNLFYKQHRASDLQQTSKAVMPVSALAIKKHWTWCPQEEFENETTCNEVCSRRRWSDNR